MLFVLRSCVPPYPDIYNLSSTDRISPAHRTSQLADLRMQIERILAWL